MVKNEKGTTPFGIIRHNIPGNVNFHGTRIPATKSLKIDLRPIFF
jgi:hypothetical protein